MNTFTPPLMGIWGLMLTSAVLIAIPGPSIMFFIGQVLSEGRAHAFRGVMGNAISMFSVAAVLALGLGSLILKSAAVLTIIRGMGVVVLLLIGIQYLRSTPSTHMAKSKRNKQSLLAGVLVGISNPKAFIMFGVIVPSFINQQLPNPSLSLISYSLIPIFLGIFIDCTWVVAAHRVSTRFQSNSQSIRMVNIVGGYLMILMALLLAWETLY